MHICIFTTVHKPFDVRIFHRQARTLAQAGHRVILFAHADFSEEIRDGIIVKGISRPKNRFFRLLSIFRFTRKCLKEKADIYHFHDFELLPAGLVLKWLTRKPVIYDCHENYPETAYERAWYPDWLKPWMSRLIAFVEPAMARKMDRVVCVVPDQQERFEKNGCKTVLIRNLPRTEIFDQAVEKNLPKENRLIYLGGLTIVRGAKVLVDMMAELKDLSTGLKLLCIGPFNEPHVEKEVKNYMRSRGVDHLIDHISYLPHEQVPDYLVTSKIGLIPWQPNQQMLRMVFPNKVLEYMSCALPVVSSDIPSLKYIFDKAQSGIVVKADDPKAYAKAILYLLRNDEQRELLGNRGRDFIKKNYNWGTEAQKLLEAYDKVMNQK